MIYWVRSTVVERTFFSAFPRSRAQKTTGSQKTAPVDPLPLFRFSGGHIFPENGSGGFPPQDPARVIVHPLRRLGHLCLRYLIKVCPLWEPPPQDPVHVLIAPTFLRGIRVAIINFRARPFQSIRTLEAGAIHELAAVVHGDGAEHFPAFQRLQ